VGAQAANEMLSIKGIRASFVFTSYQEKIFVSARSIDDVNVQRVMENMGGGGHMTIAGCQVSMPVADAIALLKHTIDQMIEEGEL
jgi:c-di-AMP phosphodiesterase-like protein